MPKNQLTPQTEEPLAKAERLFTPSLSGSLLESIRGELPDDPDVPPPLYVLVKKQPCLYGTFLGKLASGSSFKTAAFCIGVTPGRFMTWLQRGSADLMEEIDTYCSRLVLDVQRAFALAVGEAEESIFRKNPLAWLTKGPAKDFHKGRYWQDGFGEREQEYGEDQENALDPQPLRTTDAVEIEDSSVEKDLAKALVELEKHNIIQSPAFIQQAREQYRINPESDGKQ